MKECGVKGTVTYLGIISPNCFKDIYRFSYTSPQNTNIFNLTQLFFFIIFLYNTKILTYLLQFKNNLL